MPLTKNTILEKYDLIVIGSGPAGQRAAVQAAKLKKTVLVVERDLVGGGCLHTGTVPSKTLREAALRSLVTTKDPLSAVMATKNHVIEGEVGVIKAQLTRNHVHAIHGTAEFISSHSIRVKSKEDEKIISATYFVIATGTHPTHSKDIVFDNKKVFDSDTILQLEKLPATLGIVGAGVIGCEYASIFAKLGVKVTIFDRRTTLLRDIDNDVLAQLTKEFENSGITLRLAANLDKIHGSELYCNGIRQTFEALLYCMGRTGNSIELNLAKAGLNADARGYLKVNESYQTQVPHIFAVGDIIGAPGLAASGAEQGRLAANFIFTKEAVKFPATFPYGIYTIPEISCVGEQEESLKKAGTPYVVGRAYYKELARGKILGDEHGFLKLLVHKETKKIVGVHILGTQATELIHIGQVAMALDSGIEFLVNNVFNYPTLAEAYKVAAYNAYNQLR